MRIGIAETIFDPERELSRFAASRNDAGACASFVGYCRGEDGNVQRLSLQHYPGFTQAEIERLAAEVQQRYALIDVLVIHRVGAILPGEAIVLVAALSAHRAEAFAAVEKLMDYLKTDAPIWKQEHTQDGTRWVEPTAEDRARRAPHGGKT